MLRTAPLLVLPALLLGCSQEPDTADPTWHRDAAPVIEARCGGCHQSGGIGPFPLTTYQEVVDMAGPSELAISAGTMPPWQVADDCNDYSNDYSLRPDERDMLLQWFASSTPEGKPQQATQTTETLASVEIDVLLQLPEPFTPVEEPDDYRCQLVEWPLDDTAWITGVVVEPDQAAVVHHAIVFAVGADQAEAFYEMDAADDGPGYACFGGPTAATDEPQEDRSDWGITEITEGFESGELDGGVGGARWIGAWVPGVTATGAPAGTGLRMEPGDLLIVQMHYNTSSAAPVADQSSVGFRVADSVEREALVLPFTNLGWVTGIDLLGGAMTIPANETDVMHETSEESDGAYLDFVRDELALDADSPLQIHQVGHHMHLLGATGRQEVRHADGSSTCLVDIPDWDFSWQGGYQLSEPITLAADDEVYLACTWDNSAANQPIVNGVAKEPQDVVWGDGSFDEMCLSTLYMTAP